MQRDTAIFGLINDELNRQRHGLELIASENFTSLQVMQAMGSAMTNKYAEGYPGKRYYGGCEIVDKSEQLAIDRAKEIFGVSYANVQPHSGAQANAALMLAILQPGDTILGLDLSMGGHLTHGSPVNFSGKLYKAVHYGVRKEDGLVDYDMMEAQANTHKPKLIICGASAYSRDWDYARIRAIADKVAELAFAERAIEQAKRLDPAGQPVKSFAGGAIRDPARLNADQGGDHLKVVLHPVLQFEQLGVLFANLLFEVVENRAVARGGRDERHKPEGRIAVVVFDDIGPSVHHHFSVGAVPDGERTEMVAPLGDRLAQSQRTLRRLARQAFPAITQNRCIQLAREALELQVGVDHLFNRPKLRNGHRNRYLIEELLEAVAFEGDGEAWSLMQVFNTAR